MQMRGKHPLKMTKGIHVREKYTTVRVCDHYTIRTKMYDTGNTISSFKYIQLVPCTISPIMLLDLIQKKLGQIYVVKGMQHN